MEKLEKLKVEAKGNVIISISGNIVYDDHNAIMSNSKEIIAKCIGGISNFSIDTVYVYKSGVLIASKTVTVSFPTPTQARFNAVFSTASFNDTINEVRLGSAVGGEFSVITGISITKDNLHNMSIQWTIEII